MRSHQDFGSIVKMDTVKTREGLQTGTAFWPGNENKLWLPMKSRTFA